MAFAIADRVREQPTFAGGTGAVTLTTTPVSGFQSFLSGWGASGTGWYCLVLGAQWETGLGTLNAGGTTLTRTTKFNGSSGAGVAVNFAAGVLDCTGVIPAGGYGTFKNAISVVNPGANSTVTVGDDTASGFATIFITSRYVGASGAGRWKVEATNSLFYISDITAGNTLPLSIAATTGVVSIASTAASSSAANGALIVAGGVGVFGAINAGASSSITVTGAAALSIIGTTSANLTLAGGTGTSGGGFVNFNNSNSTSFLIGCASAVLGGTYSDDLIFYDRSSGTSCRVFSGSGWVFGAPTGAQQGFGTINAKAVYDDGVILTCFGIEYLIDGKIDLAKWDGYSPTGESALVHRFDAMTRRFDPRDPSQYISEMVSSRALPGMPTEADWSHNTLSVGEMHNRLWLSTELLASAFVGSHNDHERRLAALEART